MRVKQLDHLNLSVRNLEESVAWYARVFGFERVEGGTADGVAWAIIRSGEALLCLYEHPAWTLPANEERRERRQHGLNHFALRITDRAAWEATLEREQLEVAYGGEVSWPHSAAWYVSDPTGYEIEVALWDEDHVAFPAA